MIKKIVLVLLSVSCFLGKNNAQEIMNVYSKTQNDLNNSQYSAYTHIQYKGYIGNRIGILELSQYNSITKYAYFHYEDKGQSVFLNFTLLNSDKFDNNRYDISQMPSKSVNVKLRADFSTTSTQDSSLVFEGEWDIANGIFQGMAYTDENEEVKIRFQFKKILEQKILDTILHHKDLEISKYKTFNDIEILYNNDDIISMLYTYIDSTVVDEQEITDYTYETFAYTFNKKTNNLMRIDDIIKPDSIGNFIKYIEENEQYQIYNTKIIKNGCFYLVKDGIVFIDFIGKDYLQYHGHHFFVSYNKIQTFLNIK